MQNNLVRGPHKKAGTANNDFFIISWHSKDTKMSCSRSVGQSMVMDRGNYQILRFAQNDNALLRMTFLSP